MKARPAETAQPSPAPAFTLASALAWRGHRCVRHCSSALDDLPAAILFLGRRNPAQPEGIIVVVDLTDTSESVARLRRLLRRINLCTRVDTIHVLGRRMATISNALSIVTSEPVPIGARHLRLTDATEGAGRAADGHDPRSGAVDPRVDDGPDAVQPVRSTVASSPARSEARS